MRSSLKLFKRGFDTSLVTLSVAAVLAGCASAAPPAPARLAAPVAEPPQQQEAAVRPPPQMAGSISATGYAVIAVQAHKSAPQQRLMAIRAAKIDAYRGLAEQIYGLYLDTNTTVSDMTLMSDTFRTRVEGVIFGARLASITPVNNDTYEVTLLLDGSAVNDLRVLYLSQFAGKRK